MEMTSKLSTKKEKKLKAWKVLIPSIIGICLFMIPVVQGTNVTIPIAALSGILLDMLNSTISLILVSTLTLSSLGMIGYKLGLKRNFKNSAYADLFDPSPIWAIVRIAGTVFGLMTYFKVGTDILWSGNTGGLILFDLMPTLFSVFLFAGMFLPLLMDFGLLELTGTLLSGIMRPLFKLPGRASIDCIASWLGDGTIGILLTSKQYEEGFYSEREAAVIGTTFSAVSITFSLVVISQVGLSHMFLPFYGTVLITGIIAAIIMPRIAPLNKKSNTYTSNKPASEEGLSFNEGWQMALKKADSNASFKKILSGGVKNVLDMWLGVLPVVMAMGTGALIIAEYTPLFTWLGLPFVPLLEILGVPEAQAASETILVGFADMFLPSVLAASIQSEMTRFIIACLSVTQLIYMSEVGGLLLGSKIPVTLGELIVIFIERTLISLPIIVLISHFLF